MPLYLWKVPDFVFFYPFLVTENFFSIFSKIVVKTFPWIQSIEKNVLVSISKQVLVKQAPLFCNNSLKLRKSLSSMKKFDFTVSVYINQEIKTFHWPCWLRWKLANSVSTFTKLTLWPMARPVYKICLFFSWIHLNHA